MVIQSSACRGGKLVGSVWFTGQFQVGLGLGFGLIWPWVWVWVLVWVWFWVWVWVLGWSYHLYQHVGFRSSIITTIYDEVMGNDSEVGHTSENTFLTISSIRSGRCIWSSGRRAVEKNRRSSWLDSCQGCALQLRIQKLFTGRKQMLAGRQLSQ